jgi:1,3-beta-glucan synthase
MLPILLIPYADKGHSMMLFWLRPRYVLLPLCLMNHY